MKTCLSLLLLLLGLCQAQPLVGEESMADLLEDHEDMDISTEILNLISNIYSSEILLEGDLSQAQPLVGEESVDDILEDNEDMDISTKILISNNGSMSSTYTSAGTSRIVDALQSFSPSSACKRSTCIRFVRRRNQYDHISIQSRAGCYSSLGRAGGMQVLSLMRSGCMYYGIMQHEVNHALGFNHEQTRSDRDQYVKINWKNINPSNAYNFERQNTNNLNTPYDYPSIMHYGRTAFSINGRDSITPIPNSSVQIGQRKGMTRNDFLRINRLYRC
ncbi:unnamed protein product [Boreogadus saida]